MPISSTRFGKAGLDELRLYNKAVDLRHLWEQIVPGPVDEGRKVAEV